jgi:hypothetical protein
MEVHRSHVRFWTSVRLNFVREIMISKLVFLKQQADLEEE